MQHLGDHLGLVGESGSGIRHPRIIGPYLGNSAIDRVTGFTGVITGFCAYLTACSQYLVVPKCGADDKHAEGQWFDQQRVETDAMMTPMVLDNAGANGPDTPAPKR